MFCVVNVCVSAVEDAEYMIMNCPSGVPANDLRRNSASDPGSSENPHSKWLHCTVSPAASGWLTLLALQRTANESAVKHLTHISKYLDEQQNVFS